VAKRKILSPCWESNPDGKNLKSKQFKAAS
jgi:hypothetical protein